MSSQLQGISGKSYQEGRCFEMEITSVSERMLKDWQLDVRYPFSMWEVSYRNEKTAPGRVFVPRGDAIGAKLETLAWVVGPWRLRRSAVFRVPEGGGFDPVWDSAGRVVTHRKPKGKSKTFLSQHQYRPEVWQKHKTAARGSAWDIRLGDLDQPVEDDISWLKSLRLPDGRKVSIIVYYPDRGNFVHVDIRPGVVYRSRVR